LSISQRIKDRLGIDLDAAHLISRIRELEKWKSNAEPTINNNTNGIQSLLSDLKELVSDINTNLLPRIQSAQTNAEAAIKRVDVSVNNTKIELKNYTDSTVEAAKSSFADYIDSEMLKTQSTLKSYTDQALVNIESKLATALNASKIELKVYTNNQITNVQSTLKNYTDTIIQDTKNILKNYTDTTITDLKSYTDNVINQINTVANNALTKSNNAMNKAQTALAEIPVAIENAKTTLKSYTDSTINSLKTYTDDISNQIKVIATDALDKAEVAVGYAQTLVNKIAAAGTQLATDVDDLRVASNELMTVLSNEFINIRSQFVSFGNALYSSAIQIVNSAEFVKNEFIEAVGQIQTPLKHVFTYAERARKHAIWFLPYNIFMTIYWGFLK